MDLRPIPLRPLPSVVHDANVTSLVRAALAILRARGHPTLSPAAVQKDAWPDDRVASWLIKAAVSPASLTNSPALGPGIISDLVATLGPTSAAATVMQAGLSLTLPPTAASVWVPGFIAAAGNAAFISEGTPIPVKRLTSAGVSLGPHKIATIITLSSEIVNGSNAEALTRDALTRSVGLTLDAVLFDAGAASTSRPAGLLNGVAGLTPSTATAAGDALVADLTALATAVAPIGGPILFVTGAARALAIGLRQLHGIPGFSVVSSPAVAAGDIIALAPAAFVSATAPSPELDTGQEAVLHEEDTNPLPISTAGTIAAPVRSLWQSDSVGIRLRFDCSWAIRDARGVAWMTGITKW